MFCEITLVEKHYAMFSAVLSKKWVTLSMFQESAADWKGIGTNLGSGLLGADWKACLSPRYVLKQG